MNHFDISAPPAADEPTGHAPARPAMPPARTPPVRLITSEALFADFPEVQIVHGDALYRLRQTALGKLILTK